ncbi:MAG: hypothetical protein AAF512_23500 [Pseudomonadota bacterium]
MSKIMLGRYELTSELRPFNGHGGVTIHIYGPKAGKREEVLRFDCFAKEPHYHLGWSYRNAPYLLIDADDSLKWSLSTIKGDFAQLLADAGADAPTSAELVELPAAVKRFSEYCHAVKAA